MRNLTLIVFLITSFAFGQGGPKVDVIKFRGKITTTVRNSLDVPAGETWLIHNATTNLLEIAGDDDVWSTVGNGIQEGVNNLSGGLYIQNALRNSIELGSPSDGLYGSQYFLRLYGGAQPNGVGFVLTEDEAFLLNLSIAEIDASSNTSLVTKEWVLSKNLADQISFTPTAVTTSTNVQDAIEEVNDDVVAYADGILLDKDEASEIAFTPNGSIASTNVQTAIQEVRDEATGLSTENQERIDNQNTYKTITVSADDVVSSVENAAPTTTPDRGKKVRTLIDGNYNFIMNNAEPIGLPFVLKATASATDSVIVKGQTTAITFDVENGGSNPFGVEGFSLKAGTKATVMRTAADLYEVTCNCNAFDFASFLPHPNDNTANPDEMSGNALAFENNTNTLPTSIDLGASEAVVADTSNGYVSYVYEITATSASLGRRTITFNGLTNGATYNYYILYRMTQGTSGRIRSNNGFVTEFNHLNLSNTAWTPITGTVTTDATTSQWDLMASSTGAIGDKIQILISLERQ